MDRSRSKRNFHYDQDYDSETLGRTKPRYHHSNSSSHGHYYSSSSHHRRGSAARPAKLPDTSSSSAVTTTYRILCHDEKAGGVIGKSGSIIKTIRQHTGAWINVHELVSGDEERIIEISDSRRRDPDGRLPSFSPAQDALELIHERILESDSELAMGFSGGDEEDGYGPRGAGNRVTTRLVVARIHVGCLLGKGGKIIEQMRMETKTQIRVLPRDHSLPRCVSASEEIVQVLGDMNAVKKAISIISSRLRESQHRDRSQFHGRLHSPDRFFPYDDDFTPQMNKSHRSSMEGSTFGSRLSASSTSAKSNSHGSRPSYQPVECGDDLVFRMLCPADKVERVVGEADGITDLLRDEIGVDIHVVDLMAGSNEHLIIISSDEGPDDELFPAQEALLHIQTRIVDLVRDGENIVTTRLLVPSYDVGCLEGRDGSLSEMRRSTGANIQILPREEVPACISGADELVQIVGEIKTARDALVEVTSKLRSHIYREFLQKDLGQETASQISDDYSCRNPPPPPPPPPLVSQQNLQTISPSKPLRELGASNNGPTKLKEHERREDVPSGLNRIPLPLVTRSTLEIVIPEQAASKLLARSKSRLCQFGELSGANVTLVEDRPEVAEKIIQISGAPEQVDKAQSLLQGFILSTQEA